jgi:MFS family permease
MPKLSDRGVFLTLTATRWLPVGMVIGLFPLLALERGLTVSEVMTYTAAQGIAVLLLELPTSGFSDAFGRRPVLLAAAILNVVVALAFLAAHSFWAFALAAALTGVHRALDSGPLEAWYVDRVHARDPAADVALDLSKQGTITGVSLASGALLAGAIIAWHPLRAYSALVGPLLCFLALNVTHLAATALLLREAPPEGNRWARVVTSTREAWTIMGEGFSLLRRNPVVAGLVGVELFWAVGMVVSEQMHPIRLAELLGSEERAGAWNAPAAAAAWGAFGLGAALVGQLAPRLGTVRTAILARILHGLGAAAMGLMAGPASLIASFLLTTGFHGMANPPHAALLHREASSRNRATVLSINSMASLATFGLSAPLLGLAAAAWFTPTAMIAGGVWSLLGALLYLPALRRERDRNSD